VAHVTNFVTSTGSISQYQPSVLTRKLTGEHTPLIDWLEGDQRCARDRLPDVT
jgi:hypothetical protein